MRILIDNSIGVEVVAHWAKGADGDEPELVIPFLESAKLMDAWVAGDPARRSYRYGANDGDSETSALIVAYVTRHNGSLVMGDVEPWWDGVGVLDAYPLEALASELGIDTLKFGEEIDEALPEVVL